MLLSEFDYELPERLIAKYPSTPRDHSKLLVVSRSSGEIKHQHFYDLPTFLKAGDCLVRNNTKVIPARILSKTESGQNFEIFLLKKLKESLEEWICLVKPGKKVRGELSVILKDGSPARLGKTPEETFKVEFPPQKDFWAWLDKVGEPPLPPYIKRSASAEDLERYQTVFSKESGSVAAPTAGLHFTKELIDKLKNDRIEFADITLHVGYGTFAPIRTHQIEEHQMHEESFFVTKEALSTIQTARERGGRIVAVGTTSVRTLESLPKQGLSGSTSLYITPGYEFKEIDGLITNFHLPQSTLYVLVCSLLGSELCKKAYQEAIDREYRFYSYGDAMLIL